VRHIRRSKAVSLWLGEGPVSARHWRGLGGPGDRGMGGWDAGGDEPAGEMRERKRGLVWDDG
jgi:hypothetical protein